MSVAFKDNPIKRIELINNLASTGMTRAEIASELGFKDVSGLKMFARRHDLKWDTHKGLYVIEGTKTELPATIEEPPSGKVASIISMLDKKIDGKDVAKRQRFGSHQEMANYMKSKGYVWDNERQNYKKEAKAEKVKEVQTSITDSGEYTDILRLLADNMDKFTKILKENDEEVTIPRYNLPGINTLKTINITNTVNDLAKEFSEEMHISQKEMFEIALIEFMQKYGYAEQVKAVLSV